VVLHAEYVDPPPRYVPQAAPQSAFVRSASSERGAQRRRHACCYCHAAMVLPPAGAARRRQSNRGRLGDAQLRRTWGLGGHGPAGAVRGRCGGWACCCARSEDARAGRQQAPLGFCHRRTPPTHAAHWWRVCTSCWRTDSESRWCQSVATQSMGAAGAMKLGVIGHRASAQHASV
jgi:hypothetical protein